jgi:hypothetical protein
MSGPREISDAQHAEWDATQGAEQAAAQALDNHMAAEGMVRVACQWCDGEFHVPGNQPGPHSCTACAYKEGA